MALLVGAIVTQATMAVEPAGGTSSVNAPEERRAKLNEKVLITDPRWADSHFHYNHFQLDSLVSEISKFMNGESSAKTLQSKLDAVLRSSAYKNPENKELYDQFFRNLRTQLGSLENEFNQSQAEKILALKQLPAPAAAAKPAPTPVVVPPTTTDGEANEADQDQEQADKAKPKIKDNYFSFGVGLESNRLAALVLRGLGFNSDGFVRQQDTVGKVGVSFSVGDGAKEQVMEVTAHVGGGKMTSIPGSGLVDNGREASGGIDVGLVNPHAKNREFKKVSIGKYESAGIGLGVIGVTDHAGQGDGVPTPDAVVRARFYRRSDLTLSVGKNRNYQLSANTIFNNQEVNFAINNPRLQAVDENRNPINSPFATAGNLFPSAKPNLIGLGFRYWPHGAPPGVTREDLKEKFKPGEGLPKVLSVMTGGLINFSRRLTTPPAFANNRVYLGGSELFGPVTSRTQYDRLGFGLALTSGLDGNMLASTAKERAEVMERGSWLEKGVMLALDGIHLITDLALVGTAKKDPIAGQTPEELQEFIANPGMVTDFRGRGAKIDLTLFLAEWGLTGLEWSGALGRVYGEKKGLYVGTRVAMVLAGLGGFFFSAPFSGVKCGPRGTAANRCGFATTHSPSGQYFHGQGEASTPKDIKQVQRQYIVSALGAALGAFGVRGFVDLWLLPKENESTHKVHPGDVARKNRTQVSASLGASSEGASVGVRLQF